MDRYRKLNLLLSWFTMRGPDGYEGTE